MEQLKTVWTFCILLPRRKLFQSIHKAYGHIVKELNTLDGLVGVTPIGYRAVLVHMNTENDCIIAKNRLKFIGIEVSEEAYPVEVDPKTFLPEEDT
ncbi:MAG: hypothetical protein IKU94_03765 [Bacteroidaceae bacterium]|nr:hypothetical protein [Bacteroidaceae bacterium]